MTGSSTADPCRTDTSALRFYGRLAAELFQMIEEGLRNVRRQYFHLRQTKINPDGPLELIGLPGMECPRCSSTRIQHGSNDPRILLRLGGAHELLCNNCGLVFKGFTWAAKFKRIASRIKESNQNRRRAPRYKAHLPATIRLVDKKENSEPSFSPSVQGHCQTISSLGMAVSFVGSRFDPAEITKNGRLLLVVVTLPAGAVEALVKTVTHERIENPKGPANWFLGTALVEISKSDRSLLSNYLENKAKN